MEIFRKLLLGLSKYAIIVGILAFVLFLIQSYVPFLRYFFEKEPPVITVDSLPPGIGVVSQEIQIKVTDDQSGIELVRARIEQSRLNKLLFSKTLPWNTREYEETITLNAKELDLRKGNVKITIEAFDRSLESNGAKYAFELPIRLDSPSIEVLSLQHNTVETGTEAVFFKLTGEDVDKAGVLVGDRIFQAAKASDFDPDLSSVANLYVAFYSVPYSFRDDKEKLSIVAFNKVGNSSHSSFYYRIRKQRYRKWEYGSPEFLLDLNKGISESLEDLSATNYQIKKQWTDVIHKPVGRETSPEIGDYLVLGNKTIRNNFYTFRLKAGLDIPSLAPGVVTRVRNLGDELGYLVVVDHGVGFASVYSGISDCSLKEGDKVGLDQKIGQPQFLPYIGESGYVYSLTLRGMPIRPDEWWDGTWVNDHIYEKVRDIKGRFQVTSNLPPEEPELEAEDKLPVITGLGDLPSREKPKDIIRDF